MLTGHTIRTALLSVLLMASVAGLSGCKFDLSGKDTSASVAGSDVVVSGSVGDGPVTGATITVYSAAGEVLGSMVSDSSATFSSTMKVQGNQYPLRLVVSGGTDLITGSAPDFEMVSVMRRPSDKQVNINPFSTFIVRVAESKPGGLSGQNIDDARAIVLDRIGYGLDINMIPDPVNSRITDSTVANLVKASEAMGEMVRRTRDQLLASGKSASSDSVISALSADMTDGLMDGHGATGANPLVSSVANVVAGQVLVEAMSNNLRVGNAVATTSMDLSIVSVRAGVTGADLTGNVRINAQMLEQAQRALAAILVLDSSSSVQNIAATIDALSPDSMPGTVVAMLPSNSTFTLDNAVGMAATASANDMDEINQAASGNAAQSPTPLVNSAPIISGNPAAAIQVNNAYLFKPSAADADGDALSFSISGKPAWASFNTGTGRLSGTPQTADVGSWDNIVISVNDGTDTASLPAFGIVVNLPPVLNSPPVISGSPAASVTANSGYSFQPVASDPDGDSITFSIVNKPAWASFNTGSGHLTGTPLSSDVGSYGNITISVADGSDSASLPAFGIVVNPPPVVNSPPLINGSPATSVTANSGYSFQPGASDPDGDSLTFSIVNKPAWASFNTGSGRLQGTPQNTGTWNGITISVSDGTDTASLPAFGVRVDPEPVVNTAPVISGTPQTVVDANSGYVFQPNASDADGDTLTFSVANKPAWAAFSSSTGQLSGTPSAQDAGSFNNIVISVNDGTDTASLPAFGIVVKSPPVVNSPPVISGSPATSVTANSGYSFQPGASDPDGDSLTFSIVNKPAWASFNTGSGRLTGTPLNSDAGSYNNIVISVSDGTDTVSLSMFSIHVTASTGSLTLSWTAPVSRSDGTPLSLSEIAGYRIYYGSSAGNYPNSVDITNATATSASVSNVQAGNYYVVMTTYDTAGLESAQSGAVAKTAQ